jgi:hypothetical protein
MLMAQLKEYQLKGLTWLGNLYEQGINGILADEMGLGKVCLSLPPSLFSEVSVGDKEKARMQEKEDKETKEKKKMIYKKNRKNEKRRTKDGKRANAQTIQSISLLAYLAEHHNLWGPFLVIAPASTLHNWQQELARFVPRLKALPYWGSPKDRETLRKIWSRKNMTFSEGSPFHIIVTSYQLVRLLPSLLFFATFPPCPQPAKASPPDYLIHISSNAV